MVKKMSNIRITDVRAIVTRPCGSNLIIVRIDTNQPGLYGYGCATYTQRWKTVVTAIEEYMKPLLMGRDPLNIEDNFQTAWGSSYWRNGPVLNNAISGCDMAMWDILGRASRMPVWQLLGGKCRSGVPVYRHANGRDRVELEDNVRQYMEKGYQYIRCQLGGYGGKGQTYLNSPENSVSGAYFDPDAYARNVPIMFEHIRNKLGFEVELLHDSHERLVPVEAIRLAENLEPYRLFFLEDLLPPEQVEWFKLLREKSNVPIAMGELFNNPMEWQYLIKERLIDFIRVHISQIGGLTPARKLQILCENYGVRTAWHGPGDVSPIGHACNVHLDIASHNFGIQEWSGQNELIHEIFPGAIEEKAGFAYVSDKPGWGIEVNEELCKKYSCSDDLPQWTLTRKPDGTAVKP